MYQKILNTLSKLGLSFAKLREVSLFSCFHSLYSQGRGHHNVKIVCINVLKDWRSLLFRNFVQICFMNYAIISERGRIITHIRITSKFLYQNEIDSLLLSFHFLKQVFFPMSASWIKFTSIIKCGTFSCWTKKWNFTKDILWVVDDLRHVSISSPNQVTNDIKAWLNQTCWLSLGFWLVN